MDSSWQLQWAQKSLLIDPWLIGSEIDWFSWFNEQWHTTDCLNIEELGHVDAILVSQSYSDHCHMPTLSKLDPSIPLLASNKAAKRMTSKLRERNIISLPDLVKEGWTEWEGLEFCSIHPGNLLDPIYYGIGIKRNEDLCLYFSHGFELSEEQLEALVGLNVKLMASSFSEISLPALMGGKVNPDPSNARKLVKQVKPDFVVNTHDEQKKAGGIVMKMAKTYYPELKQVQFEGNTKFLQTKDYSWISI